MPTWKARMLRWKLIPGRLTALYGALALVDLVMVFVAPSLVAKVADGIGVVALTAAAFYSARGNYYRRRTKHWQGLMDLFYAQMIDRWRDEQGL